MLGIVEWWMMRVWYKNRGEAGENGEIVVGRSLNRCKVLNVMMAG